MKDKYKSGVCDPYNDRITSGGITKKYRQIPILQCYKKKCDILVIDTRMVSHKNNISPTLFIMLPI